MKNYITITALVTLCFILIAPFRTAQAQETSDDRPTIALVNRIVEIVERRSPEIDWTKAKIGDLLNSGDVVKTGAQSFALIRFYDNSLIRVRERSELIVYADRDAEAYHRNIQIDQGSVSFDVNKQEQDRFEFSTPTSVASIRGSKGTFTTDPGNLDILFMQTGRASILNLFSNQEEDVIGGQIAFSDTDGNIIVQDATEEDIEQYGEEEETEEEPERKIRRIEIRMIDKDGNPVRMIIEYEEDTETNQ